LNQLASKYTTNDFSKVLSNLPLTEFYDLVEFEAYDKSKGNTRRDNKDEKINLQEEFCDLMSDWAPEAHHKSIAKYCRDKNIPILTTNFDRVILDAFDSKLYKTTSKGLTYHYPWESYYACKELTEPTSGFGVWHINGMQRYSRSIRLGLTHYMGSVQRVRNWIYPSSSSGNVGLHENGGINNWRGHNTWLQILMTRPLVFFGLSLEENEVFLRWLLLEREKYFRKYSNDRQDAWYLSRKGKTKLGKKFFLKGAGIQLEEFDDYSELYGTEVWSDADEENR